MNFQPHDSGVLFPISYIFIACYSSVETTRCVPHLCCVIFCVGGAFGIKTVGFLYILVGAYATKVCYEEIKLSIFCAAPMLLVEILFVRHTVLPNADSGIMWFPDTDIT